MNVAICGYGAGNVRSVRPGYGLAPKHLAEVLGRRAARDLKFGEPLAWDMLVFCF